MTITFTKICNRISPRTSQILQKASSLFLINLLQFFTKVQNSFCFVFLDLPSPTVSSIHFQKASNSWLFIIGSSMANWSFSHVELSWIKLRVAFIFLKLLLHLFWRITSKYTQIHHCLQSKVPIRISLLLKLRYVFCSVFSVDHYAMLGFGFG